MSSPKPLSGAVDPDRCDDSSLAEAMEEVARAEARAEAARARATRLSRDAAGTDQGDMTDPMKTEDTDGAAVVEKSVDEAKPARWARLRGCFLRRPGRKSLAVGAAVVLICASFGMSGYVVWYHRKTGDERQRAAEFAAAARQGATTLMSMDANKARNDVQRIIDDTTGPLQAGILITEDEMVKAAEESKVSTKVTVQAVAVESMTTDSAVVLVTAKAEVVSPDKTKPPPPSRIVMNLRRDGGQLKVSGVEFLR